MQDTSCLVLPIPAHTFFKQTVLQGQIGHHLLQCGGLTTKILHLARGCSSRRITGQPTLKSRMCSFPASGSSWKSFAREGVAMDDPGTIGLLARIAMRIDDIIDHVEKGVSRR